MRPLPDLANAAAMAKLGRLSALRSARADTLHALRDTTARLLSGQHDDAAEIVQARGLLDRLQAVIDLERSEYAKPPPVAPSIDIARGR